MHSYALPGCSATPTGNRRPTPAFGPSDLQQIRRVGRPRRTAVPGQGRHSVSVDNYTRIIGTIDPDYSPLSGAASHGTSYMWILFTVGGSCATHPI